MRFAAQYVFTGHRFIRNGFVETDSAGRITDTGTLGESPVETAGTEFHNGIILPGFVNAHCHLELSGLRGTIPQGVGMTEFCRRMKSRQPQRGDEDTEAMFEADASMEREGIVAVGDIANGEASIRVKRESRLRYHSFVETLGLSPDVADFNMAKAKEAERKFLSAGLSASITPHAPYSLSEQLFRLSMKAGNAAGIISIHNKESVAEIELFVSKRGAMHTLFGNLTDAFTFRYDNPLHRILRYLAPGVRLLSVHNCCLSESDLLSTDRANTTFVLCPGSNIYIGNHIPDLAMFIEHGASIAVGTDSAASNTELSILNELKILSSRNPHVELRQLLAAATLSGAEALKIESEFGSLERGKRPGILLLSNIDFKNMRLTENSIVRKIAGR